MNVKNLFAALVAAVGLIAGAGAFAGAQEGKDTKPAAKPEFKLPPGWTAADLEACMLAGTPGKMHDRLAKETGVWQGKNTMWMAPGADPVTTECTSTITPLMDGRYTKCEMKGDFPGMGPYNGLGFYGFDNVSQKFVSTWLDNHSTGIMTGVGELSKDGKTITWTFSCNCPITKKATVMREVETNTGPNSKTLEMFSTDPKSGEEYKMMSIVLTKSK